MADVPCTIKGEKASVLVIETETEKWEAYTWQGSRFSRDLIEQYADGRPWTLFAMAVATDDSVRRCGECGRTFE